VYAEGSQQDCTDGAWNARQLDPIPLRKHAGDVEKHLGRKKYKSDGGEILIGASIVDILRLVSKTLSWRRSETGSDTHTLYMTIMIELIAWGVVKWITCFSEES
jgi:hypothetical protein